jgi:iron complex transport system permease protein
MSRVSSNGAVPKKRALRGTARFFLHLAIGLATLAVLIPLSVAYGAADVDFATVWQTVLSFDPAIPEHQIIHTMRLPRIFAAIIAGTSLAVCGAVMQGTTNNPLADSGLMGITGGATCAIAVSLAFIPARDNSMMMAAACIGAAVATGLTYFIASLSKRGITPQRLVLAGISIGALFGAFTQYLSIRYQVGQSLLWWTAGGTGGTKWEDVFLVLPFFLAGTLGAIALSPQVTMLSLGEDVAIGLGLKAQRTKAFATVIVLVLTGLSVIVIGPIGFVGLLAPHAVRALVGVDYPTSSPSVPSMGRYSLLLPTCWGAYWHARLRYPSVLYSLS